MIDLKIFYNQFEKNWNEFFLKNNKKDVILYGAGSLGIKTKKLLEDKKYIINFFVDRDSSKWGKKIDKIDVKSPESLKETDFIVISTSFWKEVAEDLIKRKIRFVNFDYIQYKLYENDIIIPFSRVVFEISGICNAQCPYCITGNGTQKGNFVDFEQLKLTVEKLINENLIDSNTVFELYNWGEPLLHPMFVNIVNFFSSLNIKFVLSSNLSKIPDKIQHANFDSLQQFNISMPGFSQNSYDKIHGFKFKDILSNIIKLTNIIPKEKIRILFHVYQFNYYEIQEAFKFFNN
ncbi:MAG: radical SAM protein, partial [Minisyncoccia bacterium]